jgi:hypothetical protein
VGAVKKGELGGGGGDVDTFCTFPKSHFPPRGVMTLQIYASIMAEHGGTAPDLPSRPGRSGEVDPRVVSELLFLRNACRTLLTRQHSVPIG